MDRRTKGFDRTGRTPLIAGGQGRSPDDLVFPGLIIFIIIALIIVAISGMMFSRRVAGYFNRPATPPSTRRATTTPGLETNLSPGARLLPHSLSARRGPKVPLSTSRPATPILAEVHGPGDGQAGMEAPLADKSGAMHTVSAKGDMRLLAAIRQVESAGDDLAVGDGGRSKGPYQCGRAAWLDGGGNPADYDRLVWDRAATEKVMLAYWKRYGAVTDEQRSRIWNGGPNGMRKHTTLVYWRKVQANL